MNRPIPYHRVPAAGRRDFLRVGSLSAAGLGIGLGISDWLRMRRVTAEGPSSSSSGDSVRRSSAKSCILIWLDGGPSHLETFDPKPDAPQEVRGPIGTIPTTLPGIRISDCLPRTAGLMDRLAIIRSMTSPLGEHNFGTHYLMTGHQPSSVLEYPAFGAVASHLNQRPSILPSNIAIPDFSVGGSNLSGGGFLPSHHQPFSVGGDPAKPNFQVRDLEFYPGLNQSRVDRRMQFIEAMNQMQLSGNDEPGPAVADPDLEKAYALVTSDDAKVAFQIEKESVEIRQEYGVKSIGQCCLLARRLIERGVPFVTVNQRGWDTHNQLYTRLKEGFAGSKTPVGLVPSLDQALGALITDLEQRGLLEETLVVVMGEFGRTPKLNAAGGRDHWPRVFSVLMAGGGIRGGQVVGQSDSMGESPIDRPITPSDLAATIYQCLGIDPGIELATNDGRPVRLTPDHARVIQELV
ncbi:DUF1501 domain-containing protein [bacterium]|nr:DUF1501 domain-containing protein [bacterium]